MKPLPVILLLSVFICSWATAQVFTEGFEKGLGSARPYHQGQDQEKLELGSRQAAQGRQYLRVALPGKAALEGFSLTVPGLPGGRLATVTAQVRGHGEIWLCLDSANGWLYSPTTVSLTDQWQTISLSKVLVTANRSLGIYFISKTVQPGTIFEVDDVKVTVAPALQVYDTTVGPWRLEAEDFAQSAKTLTAYAGASGGKVVRGTQYLALTDMPFPLTSKPVTVYFKVQTSNKETYHLSTRQGGNTQYLATLKPASPGQAKWQWLSFPAVTAGEVGDSFGLACVRDHRATGTVALDEVVVSTSPKLSSAALNAAPALFPNRPLAVVGRATSPPTIDGDPSDPCWQHAVACSGFLIVGSQIPASADTTVRLCYDNTNLYLLYVCDEPILSVAQQRRHEFVAKVKQRDGDVYRDDSAIALLDPTDTGKQVYDFTVNALGTIADAHDVGPDLWGSRDLKWNSGARAAGHIGDGVWTVEMAIPFANLGGTPHPGDTWLACLGRIAKARKETSSWNLSHTGFHDPVQFGSLVFAGETPGVTLKSPTGLQPGANVQQAELNATAGQPQGVYLLASQASAAGDHTSYQFASLPAQPTSVTQSFEVQGQGQLKVAYGVLDAGTLAPLYLSPQVTRAVRSTIATVKLTCDGPYELRLNDEVLGRGASAKGTQIKAPLQQGANVFALRLEKGTAAVRIEAPGSDLAATSWKMAPADTKGAMLAATDDVGWAAVTKTGDDPALGPIVGRPGQATVLRRTLLWEKTRVWPTPEPAYYLATSGAQHLNVIVDGLKGRKLTGWSTWLAVPPECQVVGSSGFYGRTRPDQPLFTCTQLGEQKIDGRTMRVARISADKPILAGRHYIMSMFQAFVRYRPDAGQPKQPDTSFVYWSEANGGNVSEPPQTIKVHYLPKLNGRQPRHLVFQLWGGWFSNLDDPAMREQVMATAQAAGFNDLVAGDRWTSDHAARYGLKNTMSINFASWNLDLGPYLQQHPNDRLIDHKGKPSKSLMCTTVLLSSGWPAVEAKLKQKLDEVKPNDVEYDFEFSPFNGPHSCYCPRCLAAFRKAARLPADTKLTPAIIKAKYGPQWVDFVCRQTAKLFARFKDSIHKLAPGATFSVYSGYETPGNPAQYGVDWRYVGDLQACDSAGCGYGRPAQAITATIKALKGIPLLCGALLVPYDTSVKTPQTPLTTAWLLRRLLDSTGGVLVYDRLTMDGRSWYAMGEISRLAATYEDVFLHGQRTALAGLDPAQAQVVSEGKTTLVCLMNGSSKAIDQTVKLPGAAGGGKEFYSGTEVKAGQTVKCDLAPGAVAVYILRQ